MVDGFGGVRDGSGGEYEGTMARSTPNTMRKRGNNNRMQGPLTGARQVRRPLDAGTAGWILAGKPAYMNWLDRLMLLRRGVLGVVSVVFIVLLVAGVIILSDSTLLSAWYDWLAPTIHYGFPVITIVTLIVAVVLLGYQREHAKLHHGNHWGSMLTVVMLVIMCLFTSVTTALYHSGYGVTVPVTIRYAPLVTDDGGDASHIRYGVGARDWEQTSVNTSTGYLTVTGEADLSMGLTALFNDKVDEYQNGTITSGTDDTTTGDGVCMILVNNTTVTNGYDKCSIPASIIDYSLTRGLTINKQPLQQ